MVIAVGVSCLRQSGSPTSKPVSSGIIKIIYLEVIKIKLTGIFLVSLTIFSLFVAAFLYFFPSNNAVIIISPGLI